MLVKLGKNMRSVSIVGVGATPFMDTVTDPNHPYNGITHGELFGYAALEAMEDAGLEPRDVQYFFHGHAAHMFQQSQTMNLQVADWFGMRGKGSITHSEGCCTGYVALEEAVMAVASGAYDCVLTGGAEMACGQPVENKPSHIRIPVTLEAIFPDLDTIFDRAYGRWLGGAPGMNHDDWINYYAKTYNLSADVIDDVLCKLAYHARRAAAINPLALYTGSTFDDLAKKEGFDDVWEYMKSPYNPKMTQYLRVSSNAPSADGAAACIVMPTEMARDMKQTPIEVLGTGAGVLDAIVPHEEMKSTQKASQEVYELTGLTGKDMDLLMVNDFILPSQFLSAEEVGYIPRGEGWKYALEGRLAYDGDRPICTNGGRSCYGHAMGASGMADVYEAVKQMRNQAGAHQVKKLPKHTMLRGFGGAQNVRCTILRTVD